MGVPFLDGLKDKMLNHSTKSRLHIRSIKEAARDVGDPVLDKEIAELFGEMRQAIGLSQPEIAERLNTSSQTIELLEQGNLSALPQWNEISRVVADYTKLLGLDPEPVLRRVMVQLPGSHPKRPQTQQVEPSYDNMQANASAVMHRVPTGESAIESASLSVHSQHGSGGHLQGRDASQQPVFSPGYGDMRAMPPGSMAHGKQGSARTVAKRRKTSVFVPLVQFLLLLIILATGYLMWLGNNDPQGYEDLKSLALNRWEMALEQAEVWKTFLLKQLRSL